MKTKYSTSNPKVNKQEAKTSPRLVAPIPLERPEILEFNKGDGQTYKLKNDPSDADSPVFEVSIRYFSGGSCEEFLIFETNLKVVFKGQNVTDGPGRFAVTKRILRGGALTTFTQALPVGGTETLISWKTCMEAVRASVFPKFAGVLQRQMMREGKAFRKPADMSTQQYVDRMRELNDYLTRFPPTSPTSPSKKMDNEDFLDALKLSVPSSWVGEMIKAGFWPHEHSVEEFVFKCQGFEVAEGHQGRQGQSSNEGSPSKKGKGKREHTQSNLDKPGGFANKKPKFNDEGLLMCPLHGNHHPMQKCRTLLGQAKNMKGMWDAQDSNERRKIQKEQKAARELNTVEGIQKLVAKKFEEHLAKTNKSKRKKDLNTFEVHSLSSDSDSEHIPGTPIEGFSTDEE